MRKTTETSFLAPKLQLARLNQLRLALNMPYCWLVATLVCCRTWHVNTIFPSAEGVCCDVIPFQTILSHLSFWMPWSKTDHVPSGECSTKYRIDSIGIGFLAKSCHQDGNIATQHFHHIRQGHTRVIFCMEFYVCNVLLYYAWIIGSPSGCSGSSWYKKWSSSPEVRILTMVRAIESYTLLQCNYCNYGYTMSEPWIEIRSVETSKTTFILPLNWQQHASTWINSKACCW